MKSLQALSLTARRTSLTSFVVIALLAAGCSHHSGDHTNVSEAAGGAESVAITEDADSGTVQSGEKQSGEGAHSEDAHSAHDGAHSADHSGHGGVKTNHDVFHSKALEVPAGKPVPALTVRVDDDPVRGWNLYVGTANFQFTPADINGESSPTSGHAHLYINEEPVQRIYGNWTHLPDLPAGTNEIRVTLNANSHETLTTQGQPIEETVTVEVYDPNAS
ncbi:MAG: hypothetical protein AAF703_02945 [Cyanobacteria bacterium P01_D01_bin.105]